MISLEERRKRFGKRWRRKNLVRKLLKRTQVVFVNDHDADGHDVDAGDFSWS